MGKLRLQGVSWSEVTEQSIVKPWKVNWRGGKERHGSCREGQRMERGTSESAAGFEDDSSVKGWQEQGGWGAGGSALLYTVLTRVYSGQRPFRRYYWRWRLRLTFWDCHDVPETAFGECVMVLQREAEAGFGRWYSCGHRSGRALTPRRGCWLLIVSLFCGAVIFVSFMVMI